MKMNKKGFTLAELLVVVAIIAVLVAISIPVFSAQTEKAAEATDAANLRSAYAKLISEYVSGNTSPESIDVVAKQKTAGWQTPSGLPTEFTVAAYAEGKSGWTVSIDSNGVVSAALKN